MAIWIDETEKDPRRVIQALQEVIKGNINAVGVVTLNPGAASTVVTRDIVAKSAHVILTPRTANAALEIGNGTLYVPATIAGAFTIIHANNAQADRTFTYAVLGGNL